MARRKNAATATDATEAPAVPAKRGSKKNEDQSTQIPDELKAQYEAAGLEIKPISSENGGGFGVVRSNGKTGRSKRYESLDICPDVQTLETWINDFMVEQENSAAQEAAVNESQEVIDHEETAQEPQEEATAIEAETPVEAEAPIVATVAPDQEPVEGGSDDRSLEGWTDVILNSDAAPAPEASTDATPEAELPVEEDLRPVQEIFTTAPEQYDIESDLVSSELLPYINAEGLRWRLVKTRNFDKQRDIYVDADGGLLYAAIGRLYWEGGKAPDGGDITGLGQFQVSAPLDDPENPPAVEATPARRGRRRGAAAASNGNGSTPAPVTAEEEDDLTPVAVPDSIKVLIATPAMDYYKPSGITQTMPPEWEQVIQLLESGASLDQLNELLGVTEKPFYYSQHLGRYGKGMKREGDRYVLVN